MNVKMKHTSVEVIHTVLIQKGITTVSVLLGTSGMENHAKVMLCLQTALISFVASTMLQKSMSVLKGAYVMQMPCVITQRVAIPASVERGTLEMGQTVKV